MKMITSAYTSKAERTVEREVEQGSLLSPTLINYIDTSRSIAEQRMVELKHREHPSNCVVILFADDVKLGATTMGKFQHLLDVSVT